MKTDRSSHSRHRHEIGRRGELDVHLQLVLHLRDRPKDGVELRNEGDVDVDRRTAPAVEDGGGAAREVRGAVGVCGSAQRTHQPPNPICVR